MSLGVDLSPSLTLTNDLAAVAEAVDVPALVARDDLTLALSLGRHTLELRGTAAAAEYKSGISDGPFADDLVAGAEAGWQVALGDDWAARASAGATYTRRDNRTFYFGQDKGIHVGVEPTAHVRVGRPRAFVEAARGVKLDALMHDTYVTSEALASFSQPLGTRFSIGAEGGVAQSVPLTDDNEDILTVRGAASFGWQLSKSLGLAARYELLHQEAFRTMRYQTVLVAAEVRGP